MCIYKYLYTYAYGFIYICFIYVHICVYIYIYTHIHMCEASQVVLVVKNPLANSGDLRDSGSIPGWGRSPGRGHGNPLQDSCLENPRDRGAWWATVHGVTESRARLSNTRTHWKKCCSSFTQLVTWPSWVWLPVPYPAEMRLWLGDMFHSHEDVFFSLRVLLFSHFGFFFFLRASLKNKK